MSEAMQFAIGTEVTCRDGICGDLTRVVVDPVARAMTHLVVEPKHRVGMARLVPIDLVDQTTGQLHLRCSTAEFDKLTEAEETRFFESAAAVSGDSSGQVLMWPYYGLGMGAIGGGTLPSPITYDKVPLNEVEVRRGEQVLATDGAIGRVQGLIIDPRDHQVTHVLLDEGHLWGRKQVAIPISAVAGVEDGIRLTISKEDVQHLPDVRIDQASD